MGVCGCWVCVGVGHVWVCVVGMCGCGMGECVGVVCGHVWVWYVGMCGCGMWECVQEV